MMLIAADHGALELKDSIAAFLTERGIDFKDCGAYDAASVDYPDYAEKVAGPVSRGEAERGILLCGSGQGVCITANKHQGIRAALVWDIPLAPLARQHNDANVICIPVRFTELETAIASVQAFLDTEFEGGRHQLRVDKIAC